MTRRRESERSRPMSRNSASNQVSLMFAMLAIVWMFTAGVPQAAGQACAGQNWAASTPNVWAAGESVKVMLNNDASTNEPTIPIYEFDGNFNPWGFQQHPQTITELNSVWSCPSGSPVIAVAGAGRETVSFQLFISASASAGLSDVSVAVSPLTGAGTLTSDNTGSSNVTRYLEGYVPYSGSNPNAPTQVQANGQMPDPLIPFYDPFDSGNPAVATPFNVQAGTTQGVWVNVSIPASQAAGTYTGTVTVTGNGIGSVSIPVSMTVWNGNLPTFDAGSVNPTYADMLKSWLPFYRGNFDYGEGMTCGGPGCTTEQALLAKYQIMGHAYDMDVQMDVDGPGIGNDYPAYGSTTSFTTDGHTSSLDWTAYDAYVGPSLTPGGLFSDGTYMRVFDSPLSTAGAGAWVGGGWNWSEQNGNAPVPPSGLMQLVTNYSTQISQHFAANHANKGWGQPELISYTFDETYNNGHSKDVGGNPLIYQIISSYNEAINSSDSALSPTWAASTSPIHNFLTDEPACQEDGDNPQYTASVCADHINLSYPGGTNATAGYTNSWVNIWSPNPSVFMPGRPGPPLSYGTNPTIIAGTGYQYTMDLTNGVPALSTAPLPIERWFYQGGDPFSIGDGISATGVGQRINYWIAYKYGLDETVPSAGDPSPAAPAPGGVWIWVGNFWGGYGGASTPANCGSSNAPSPFVSAATGGDGVLFYPGNEVGCYYSANPVGQAVLTANPAVNTSCTSNGYNTCNGISGPVASIRMEAMRRGYEDYEYMYLLGKQSGRSAPMAIINSLGVAGMTQGGQGTTSWQALDWENTDGPWYAMGVEPESSAYSGYCTDSTPGLGGLANGLPKGSTGAASTGSNFGYGSCPGEWTNNPYRIEAARVQLAQALGFAPAGTAPTITAVSPSSGVNSGGTSVVVTGTNFTGATQVQFGGVEAASFTVNSSTQITAVTPAGSGTVDVQVFGPGGGSQPGNNDQYTFVSPVTVTSLSPSQGVAAGGNSVNITGTDFAAGATVLFGNKAATGVVVNSASSITATAPSGSNSVYVTVTTSQGTSATNSSNLYTYEAPPTVSGLSPNSGPIAGGTSVTISGSGFVSGMTVHFGGNAATGVTVNSSSSATVTSPHGSSQSGGVVDVTVSTTNGTSTINGQDQYNYTSPVTVTGLSVRSGPPGGGTSVVITGTDFSGATSVKFGGNSASFTVNSATQITATSPAGGGTVDVTVTIPSYSSEATLADQFSYTSAVAKGTFATLPTTNVGSASASQNVSVTLQSATAISSITVPKAQNGVQEFAVGTVSGCSVGGTVNAANTVCTVAITFHPQYPGVRMGTLTVNNAGTVVGTAGLAGIGQGPEIAVRPGALAMAIGGGVSGVTATPQSVTTAALSDQKNGNNGASLAMDGAGNLYIADLTNCMAYKVTAATNQIVAIAGDYTFSGHAPAVTTTPEPALGSNTCPQGIGVDGAGNVYIIDANAVNSNGYPNVVEEVSAATGQIFVMAGGGAAAPSTTPQAATNVALNAINSLATDGAGNLYIADFYNNLVEKVTPAGQLAIFAGGGSTPVSTTPQAATSAQLNGPTGMVMDASGNFFISDQNIGVIERVNSSGQIVSVAGGGGSAPSTTPQAALSVAISNPAGLAVDGAGDLYIADYSNQVVDQVNLAGQLVVVAGGGGTVPSSTVQSSTSARLGLIEGVEVDGAGNIYIADGQDIGGGDNMIEKVSATSAPLNFPYTNVGSTSVPQSVKLVNIGNQSLSLASVSAATDFPLQSGGTCTVTPTSGQSLAVSNNCSLSYAFHPTTGGVLNEAANLNDNNLNASGSTQPIAFTGTGVGGTNPQLTSISPSSGASGTSVTVTGTNLSGATTMTFGSTPVTPSSSTSTTATAVAPSGSGTVSVTVTTANGTSNGESFTYSASAAATPTFSPAAGTYSSAQTVTISDSTSGATIYYTTNGTTPTTSSAVYSGPISVSASETVEAIATASGYTTSAVGSAAYTISAGGIATPTFSPAGGTYSSAQNVTISDATGGTTIHYTTDGTTPTGSSPVYSGPITVSATETIEAIASSGGGSGAQLATNSDFATTPPMTPGAGTYTYNPTNVSGWTFSSGSGVAEYGSAWNFTAATDGANQVAFLQNTSTITQTISGLTTGQQYTVSFYLEDRPGYTSNPIVVSMGGTTLLSTTPGSGWTLYTETFTASSNSAVLSFSTSANSGDNDTGLSDVSVTAPLGANSDFATTPPMTPGAGIYTYDPTNVAGWTFSGPTQNASSGSYGSGVAENGSAWGFTAPPDGANQVAFLQGTSTLTQTINGLASGQQYTVSFYLEARPNYPGDPIVVSVGGTTLLSTTPGSGWTLYTETFTANASSEVLSFSTSANGGDYDTGLSDVTLSGAGSMTSAVGSATYTISGAGLPVTDSFNGSGALSSNWTNTTANQGLSYPFVPLTQANGVVVPITSTQGKRGLELYTGATFPNDQYSQVKFVYESAGSYSGTGPCVRMGLNANGVCWLVDSNVVYTISSGAWYGATIITGCPIPTAGDTVKLSVAGTTYTCTDVTTGAHASGTNTDFSTGVPAILVDQSQSTSYALDNFQAD